MRAQEPLGARSTQELAESFGLVFKRPELLAAALTHSSYLKVARSSGDAATQSYERLEFLGDSILAMVLSERLFAHPELFAEGVMSKLRASLVNEEALANCARRLELGSYLRLSHGEERSGGRLKSSVLADAFEAVIAAIFLEFGLPEARAFIVRALDPQLSQTLVQHEDADFKTALQELTQGQHRLAPEYHVVSQEGPPHQPIFAVTVSLDGKVLATGQGISKKRASQAAAREALVALRRHHEGVPSMPSALEISP